MPEPLALALHPLMPVRMPRGGRPTVLYGYHLRLAGGPTVTNDDPLLNAFAASVEAIEGTDSNNEPLQSDSFDPGLRAQLVREGVDDDGDEIVGVWDHDDVRRAGALPFETAARVAAALDHGLDIEALVLSEIRQRSDNRRCGIAVLVYPPALISLDAAAGGPLQRPQPHTRSRLVLIADDAAGLRWWDPSGATGPIDLDAVPVSTTLGQELHELAVAFKDKTPHDEEWQESDFLDEMEQQWQRHALDQRVRSTWERVRRELGRRYAVGLMLKGMAAPAWSPEEFDDDDEDEEIPF